MKSYLWIRKWRIVVTDKNDNKAIDVSDLHCTFTVQKKRDLIGNTATVKIYNLSNEMEQQIIEEGDRVVIEAGYAGTYKKEKSNTEGDLSTVLAESKRTDDAKVQYGKIFDGQVIYPSRSKGSNTDFILTLSCVGGGDFLGSSFIKESYNRGLNQRQVVERVCSAAKTPINHISEGLSNQRLPRGKVFFGKVTKYIQDVIRGNAAMAYIEDSGVIVSKLTDVANTEAIVIEPDTGLIGMPQQTVFGMDFKVLLNPFIKLGTKVRLKRSEVNELPPKPQQPRMSLDPDWTYQAIEVLHKGDTRGQDWYTEIKGISRYGKGSLPAMLASADRNGN